MISVVIPTHNRLDLLKNAIQSVVNQTYKNIEIIVVDDASSCNNKDIVESFRRSIIYYRFETNQGGNVCRNKGVELATGEYIAFLDDDDVWHSEKLEKQYQLMNETDVDLCYTGRNIIVVDEKLQEINRRYSFSRPKFVSLKKSIMQKNFIGTTSSILIKKEKFLDTDGFCIKMPALQDYEFYIRFIYNDFKVIGIDDGLVDYYIYQKKSAISKTLKKRFDAAKQMIKKNRSKEYIILLYALPLKIIVKYILFGHR